MDKWRYMTITCGEHRKCHFPIPEEPSHGGMIIMSGVDLGEVISGSFFKVLL
jgi:hypothetical protein